VTRGNTLFEMVELAGVIAEHQAGDFQSAGAGDLAIMHHFGEREAERLAAGGAGDPTGLLPAHFLREWIGVGGEHHLLGRIFEPFADGSGDGARIIREGLLGEIGIGVGF